MALHRSNPRSNDLEEHAIGETIDALVSPLPRTTFPQECRPALTTFNLLKEELLLDGNSKQNLATFCQPYESQQVAELMALAVDKNLIDKDDIPKPQRLNAVVFR